MLRDFPQFVPQKVCLSCDGCCRFKEATSIWRPKITREEITQKKSSLIEKIFSKQAIDSRGYLKTVMKGSVCQCTFFNLEDNTCRIYDNRPFECQLYPFLLNKRGKEIVISVHLMCPHVQEKRNAPQFENYVVALKQFFQKRDIKDFLRRNPNLATDYSDYDEELEDIFILDV